MKKLIILFFLVFFYTVNSYATITLTDSFKSLLIGKDLYMLTPGGDLTFQQVRRSADFVPLSEKIPNLGLHSAPVWLKFTISNQSAKDHFLLKIDYAILNRVDLYIPVKGHYLLKHSGESIPFAKREFKPPFILFDLELPPGSQKTYYIRVKSPEQIILPISLTTPRSLWENSFVENLAIGLFMGIILIMAVYNLFLGISTRDRSYIYYVAYIVFAGLTQTGISGFNYLLLWPDSPKFEMISVQLFACLGGAFALLFTHHFLRIDKYAPLLNKFFIILISIFGCALIMSVLNLNKLGFLVMQLNTTVTSIAIISASFYIMVKVKDYVPAKIFFVAWAILVSTSIIFLLKDSNILPYNSFTRYSFKLGTVIEASLLSFALAYRINILKREREMSQSEMLRLANENRRILSEQNIMLEKQVSERTQELFDKNVALHAANEHLKQTQTQLVAAEKMSSLGQLTAGIAHEINNPINFVSANISPLKRDIEQLFNTIAAIESIGLEEGKAAAVKLMEMAAYKEAQELDYLQEEIDQLLNGIHDGASRTASIVRGLRLFSRLDEDAWKEANLNEGLQSTLAITGNTLKGIELNTQFGELPPVVCFPGKLNQIFLNIITNAAFAIRQKHGDNIGGHLWLRTWQEGEFVFVSIKDDGIGMDQATLSKLYEPFFTTKPVGEGTGLGMSIVFTIVEQHHARLNVWSEPGKGTEFTLKLYIQPPVDDPA
ncbi:MAG TPA: 7TM diverse intracellular signaling domain-containing protein [Edaphocola sp.]|nr:7TM diverse intracellular signaling domain-containing protein [Edaphocola sp.]